MRGRTGNPDAQWVSACLSQCEINGGRRRAFAAKPFLVPILGGRLPLPSFVGDCQRFAGVLPRGLRPIARWLFANVDDNSCSFQTREPPASPVICQRAFCRTSQGSAPPQILDCLGWDHGPLNGAALAFSGTNRVSVGHNLKQSREGTCPKDQGHNRLSRFLRETASKDP